MNHAVCLLTKPANSIEKMGRLENIFNLEGHFLQKTRLHFEWSVIERVRHPFPLCMISILSFGSFKSGQRNWVSDLLIHEIF